MIRNVTYPADMRALAIKEGKGLVTISVTRPCQARGRLGGTVTVQRPATATECKTVERALKSQLKAMAKG